MTRTSLFALAALCCPFVAHAQCPVGQTEAIVTIVPDNYPNETSWELFADNVLVATGGINSDTVCVDTTACMVFEIYDTYGDGICCGYGQGSYTLTFDGVIMDEGGQFTEQATEQFNCPVDTAGILTALQAMIAHVDNSIPLSLVQREAYVSEIILLGYTDVFLAIRDEVLTYITEYETNYPVIFENRQPVNISTLAPETRLLIDFEQYILDAQLTDGTIAAMEGVVFAFSSVFPGPVDPDAPRIANAVVPINGTHVHIPAAITAFDLDPAKRPTGYYAAPGEIVTITIPAGLVGAGLMAQIGTQDADITPTWTNRLSRITCDFPLDAISTQIISPLGGCIYIKVPEPSALGWFDVVIDQAVRSPYFSMRTDHLTPVAEWQAALAAHTTEWVDMEADKFMMTLPWTHVQGLLDPTSLLTQWNAIMDAYNYMGGRPAEARSKAEYFSVDTKLPVGAFGIGYPQVIGEFYAPFGPLGGTGYYPTRVLSPNPQLSALSTTFHELGHAAAHPKMTTERETLVNIYAVHVFNELYGVPLDEAFKHSEFQLLTLDQAAVDWMVSHNFRNNVNMSCDPLLPADICDELRYQHRGHAKYVEMAKQFGWSSFHGMNNVFYQQDLINPGVWDDIFKESDEIIEAASDAMGVNMSPLFHFWGLAPSPALALELETDYGFSQQLCEMLQYYKTVIPETGADLQAWLDDLDNQSAFGTGRYEVYLAEYDALDYHGAMQAQIDYLLDIYGACLTSGMEEAAEPTIAVAPNPTSGQVTVHSTYSAPVHLEIVDVHGRVVFRQENIRGPVHRFELDEVPGVYTVRFDTGSDQVFFKLVKTE